MQETSKALLKTSCRARFSSLLAHLSRLMDSIRKKSIILFLLHCLYFNHSSGGTGYEVIAKQRATESQVGDLTIRPVVRKG